MAAMSAEMSRPMGRPPRPFSKHAEDALAELVKAGCDRDELRARVWVARQWPVRMGRRKLLSIVRQLTQLANDLKRLQSSAEGLALFPSLSSTELGPTVGHLVRVRELLDTSLARSSRRRFDLDMLLASLCAYLMKAT